MNESTPDTDRPSTSAARPQTTTSSNSGSNQRDSHIVLAKCSRNADVTDTTKNNGPQETSEDSEAEENLLAVYCRAGKLGAAYYTLQTGELFILEEIVDRQPEFPMFLNLFRQVDPVIILLDGKNQGTFVQKVKKTVFENDAQGHGNCKLTFLSAREYSYEACKRRIFTLNLPNEPSPCTDEERTMFLRTVMDFSHIQTVHAFGALLRYLDLNWTNLSMNMQSRPQFLSLRIISLADIVTIDDDTYRGLQIFRTVAHPSGFKKGMQGSNKEGLSLFQLFSKCSSKVGQSRMRIYLQHPSRDLATLMRRQDVVDFFMQPQNEPLMRNICSSLRFIKNVTTLHNAVLICEICENAGQSEFLEQLASCDNNKLYEMALYMNRIIDFDLSKSEGKFTVKAGVDPELDMKKQTMASLHSLMSETAKVELSRLPEFIEECSMLYMPHLGYLLGVKAWAEYLTMEQKELPNMKFMFQNNDYIHYKSKGCEGKYNTTHLLFPLQNNSKDLDVTELDVMIGDTYPEIVAHETRIKMRLTTVILENLHTLAAIIDKCAELDCLIAISKVCKEYNYVRPRLSEDNIISIKEGKHPLHIVTNDNFVPNDVESSEEAGCMKILTGPNSSGKSVYMKMVGLIVYLAHVGSFVPAESATIGVVSHIHSRIQSAECVAAHMSAFLLDLRQMSVCLNECRSLLIVDEFGKGTGRADGLALLAAIINTLLFRGQSSSHVLISTHYLNIKDYVVNSPSVKFLSFESILQDGEPVFLFRVKEGLTESSFANSVAVANGLEARVAARAREVMDSIMNNTTPPANKKIISKLQARTENIKSYLCRDDI